MTVLYTKIQSNSPGSGKLTNRSSDNLRRTSDRPRFMSRDFVCITEQEGIIYSREVGNFIVINIPLRIDLLRGIHDVIHSKPNVRERNSGLIINPVSRTNKIIFGNPCKIL